MPWGGPIDRTKLWCLTYTGFADSFFDKLFTIDDHCNSKTRQITHIEALLVSVYSVCCIGW